MGKLLLPDTPPPATRVTLGEAALSWVRQHPNQTLLRIVSPAVSARFIDWLFSQPQMATRNAQILVGTGKAAIPGHCNNSAYEHARSLVLSDRVTIRACRPPGGALGVRLWHHDNKYLLGASASIGAMSSSNQIAMTINDSSWDSMQLDYYMTQLDSCAETVTDAAMRSWHQFRAKLRSRDQHPSSRAGSNVIELPKRLTTRT